MTYIYEQDEPVIIHSVEPTGKEFRAVINGKYCDYGDSPATIYIVKFIDKIDDSYKFTHGTMPAACLRKVD